MVLPCIWFDPFGWAGPWFLSVTVLMPETNYFTGLGLFSVRCSLPAA